MQMKWDLTKIYKTKEEWEETLRKIVNLNPKPEHISAYSLIIEEGTPFYRSIMESQVFFPARRRNGKCTT